MKKNSALSIIRLTPPNYQLVVLLGDLKVVHRKTGDRQRDPQSGRADLLDVVGRVSVGRRLRRTLNHLLEMVEAQEQRRGKHTSGQGPPPMSEASPGTRSGIPVLSILAAGSEVTSPLLTAG